MELVDPEVTLANMRDLAARITRSMDADDGDTIQEREDCASFVALFQAFDEWRINGGFLPEAWAKP